MYIHIYNICIYTYMFPETKYFYIHLILTSGFNLDNRRLSDGWSIPFRLSETGAKRLLHNMIEICNNVEKGQKFIKCISITQICGCFGKIYYYEWSDFMDEMLLWTYFAISKPIFLKLISKTNENGRIGDLNKTYRNRLNLSCIRS